MLYTDPNLDWELTDKECPECEESLYKRYEGLGDFYGVMYFCMNCKYED